MDLRAVFVALATLGCGDGNIGVATLSEGSEGSGGATTSTGEVSTGSSESPSGSSTAGIEPEVDWPHLACDPLVESLCALPFPNNVFTVADPSTPTGRRVALDPSATPVHENGTAALPLPFDRSDGFSTSAAMLAHLPGATATGLPTPLDIGRSVESDTPTIVLDAESGELHPHFSEIDSATADLDRRALIIRPVVPLLPGRRYIVAMRGVVDAAGAVLPPTPAFAALRDGTPDPLIEERRGLYADIFARLQPIAARDELQLAWDFTTASVHDSTSTMIAMRDDALAEVGEEGPAYTIDEVQMDPFPDVALRIEGTMSVPLYLDDPGPGGALVLDDEGRPQQNGLADYPFLVLVPPSAARAPAGILHIGHGLLGERFQAEAEYYRAFGEENGWVIVATDWIGMANEDVPHILGILGTGELDRFHTVCDRLQQGVLNAVLVIRLLGSGLADDPLLAGMIDPSRVAYIGSSQGGILGGVLAAVSPDIQRAVLDVPGQPYNLLLERSVDFSPFLNVLRTGYRDPLDVQMVLVLAQMLWDRAEPAGYTRHLRADPLPGSGAKDVLLQVAIGDHQVTTLGAHVMARAIGAPNLVPANREIWGLATADGSAEGVGMIEYDFGLPPEPLGNVPMEEGEDPHGLVRRLSASIQTRAQFLATGTIETFCDGPCDPE